MLAWQTGSTMPLIGEGRSERVTAVGADGDQPAIVAPVTAHVEHQPAVGRLDGLRLVAMGPDHAARAASSCRRRR